MDFLTGIFKFAANANIGFGELVFALCVLIGVWRSPEIIKALSLHFNERRKIDGEIEWRKQTQLDKLRKRRTPRVPRRSNK